MSEVPLYEVEFESTRKQLVGAAVTGSRIYFTEMCSGSEKGSYLRLIDFRLTQL